MQKETQVPNISCQFVLQNLYDRKKAFKCPLQPYNSRQEVLEFDELPKPVRLPRRQREWSHKRRSSFLHYGVTRWIKTQSQKIWEKQCSLSYSTASTTLISKRTELSCKCWLPDIKKSEHTHFGSSRSSTDVSDRIVWKVSPPGIEASSLCCANKCRSVDGGSDVGAAAGAQRQQCGPVGQMRTQACCWCLGLGHSDLPSH